MFAAEGYLVLVLVFSIVFKSSRTHNPKAKIRVLHRLRPGPPRYLVFSCVWGFGKERVWSSVLFRVYLLGFLLGSHGVLWPVVFPWQLILATQGDSRRWKKRGPWCSGHGHRYLPQSRASLKTTCKQKGPWQGLPCCLWFSCGVSITFCPTPTPQSPGLSPCSSPAHPTAGGQDRGVPSLCPQVLSQRGPGSSWQFPRAVCGEEQTRSGTEGHKTQCSCACPFPHIPPFGLTLKRTPQHPSPRQNSRHATVGFSS